MNKYRIPQRNKDLKRFAFWRNMKYLLLFVGYLCFWSFGLLFYLSRRYVGASRLEWWVYLLFTLTMLISGWCICFMNRFIFDRSRTGRLSETQYTRNFDRGLSRRGKFSLDEHTYIKAKLVLPDGKTKKVKFPLFDDGYDGYYCEGDEIVKFRGLNYPLSLRAEEEGIHLCTVCGVRTFYKEGKAIHGEAQPEIRDGLLICRSCKHTMIDIHELRGTKK